MSRPHAALVASSLLALAGLAPAQSFVSLPAKSTYLHINSDPVPGAVPVALAPLGLTPGTCLRLRAVGDYDQGPGGDTVKDALGLFSADSTLLAGSLAKRVPGAIDAGTDFATATTFMGNQLTDVPEDFSVANGTLGTTEVTVEVPAGANFLFLCTYDHYYSDNSDPNANFGVEITVVGCWKDLGHALAGASGLPTLTGTGTLLGGDPLTLTVANARPASTAALIVGLGQLDAPFKGGTLVPTLNLLVPGLPTGAGSITLPATWPAGLPSDFSLYFQAWIADAAGPHGFSATNGLSATTP
jgi:hypothetical protein